ncbi:MAG: Asp-tRNA(Asn)/Glu-tRNA(Gln) amidotransferase subunit GatA [Gemmatimonadota bacterium]
MTSLTLVADLVDRLESAAALNATLAWSHAALEAEAAISGTRSGGRLAGMPIAIKDNIVTTTLPTTCASRILEGYISPFEATVVTRLREAGALIACKANLDEFAMGSSTEHSAYGRVHHPLDRDLVPGGSSGGSAALVAAGVVPAALGSETGGSVRQPAAFCGIVGIKPTYGRVSRHGLVAFGSSLDCVSPFGRTVDDAARVLEAISGHDPRDVTTHALPPLDASERLKRLDGITIGLPDEYFPDDLDPGIRAACDTTIARLRELGATVRRVSLPHTSSAVPAYYIVNPAEAAANLARYDGVRYGTRQIGEAGDLRALYRATRGRGFGPEVRRRILVGTFALSAGYADRYYARAQAARRGIITDFTQVFASGVDLLFTPTTPTPAFRAGEKLADPVQMYLADVFVCPASLAGVPAMSQPIGRSGGLPIGGQLIGPSLGEGRMIAVARLLESVVDAIAEVR